MIKINLLGGDELTEGNNTIWIAGWAASLLIVVIVLVLINANVNSKISVLEDDTGELKRKLASLQEVTKEVRHLEKLESELNSKLAVIATLKKSKIGPVRILDDLNVALPERAWITQVKEDRGRMVLVGYALDDHTISEFMKVLESSDYFGVVDLDHSKQVKVEGAKIRAFRITAKVNYAGKIVSEKETVGQGTLKAGKI